VTRLAWFCLLGERRPPGICFASFTTRPFRRSLAKLRTSSRGTRSLMAFRSNPYTMSSCRSSSSSLDILQSRSRWTGHNHVLIDHHCGGLWGDEGFPKQTVVGDLRLCFTYFTKLVQVIINHKIFPSPGQCEALLPACFALVCGLK
jgi:hypothetical protein